VGGDRETVKDLHGSRPKSLVVERAVPEEPEDSVNAGQPLRERQALRLDHQIHSHRLASQGEQPVDENQLGRRERIPDAGHPLGIELVEPLAQLCLRSSERAGAPVGLLLVEQGLEGRTLGEQPGRLAALVPKEPTAPSGLRGLSGDAGRHERP
jgi:hypothetical protein